MVHFWDLKRVCICNFHWHIGIDAGRSMATGNQMIRALLWEVHSLCENYQTFLHQATQALYTPSFTEKGNVMAQDDNLWGQGIRQAWQVPCMAWSPLASPRNISNPLPLDSFTKYFCPASVTNTFAEDQPLPPMACFLVILPPSRFSSIQLSTGSPPLQSGLNLQSGLDLPQETSTASGAALVGCMTCLTVIQGCQSQNASVSKEFLQGSAILDI